MKIWGGPPKVVGAYNNQKVTEKVHKTPNTVSKKDIVSISSDAKDYQTVMKALKDIPDIRKEKVEELLKKYESGNYNVSGSEVADKIIKSIIDMRA